jgi:hypothetical protein
MSQDVIEEGTRSLAPTSWEGAISTDLGGQAALSFIAGFFMYVIPR